MKKSISFFNFFPMPDFGGAGVDNHPHIFSMSCRHPRISGANTVAEHSFEGTDEDALKDATIHSEKKNDF
jgi:hypothetical protein